MRREIDADEREALEELEARFRQTYDPEQKVYDGRKRRVTDLKENNRVTLPKPLGRKLIQGGSCEIQLGCSDYTKGCIQDLAGITKFHPVQFRDRLLVNTVKVQSLPSLCSS